MHAEKKSPPGRGAQHHHHHHHKSPQLQQSRGWGRGRDGASLFSPSSASTTSAASQWPPLPSLSSSSSSTTSSSSFCSSASSSSLSSSLSATTSTATSPRKKAELASPERTSPTSSRNGRRRNRLRGTARRQTVPFNHGADLSGAADDDQTDGFVVMRGGRRKNGSATVAGDVASASLLTDSSQGLNRSKSVPLGMASHFAPPEQSALLRAAKEGQTELLARLLAMGEDVNVRSFGSSPLHWAAYQGHVDCVDLLLKADGIDVNAKESEHRTPLALAARMGHTDCLRLLIAVGADIDSKSKWDETPLSKAATYNHVACVQLLLEHKADPNCVDIWMETPLFKSAVKGHAECMSLLLAGGADVNKANELCQTPLHAAIMGGFTECVKLLLEYGADPEAMDGDGRLAKEYSHEDLHDILTDAMREKRLKALEAKGVSSWTSKEVGEWIEIAGYPQYKSNFTKNHITGSVLLQKLDMEVLKKELGILSYGARSDILKRIAVMPYQNHKRGLRPSSSIHNIGDKIATIDYSELVLHEVIGKGFFGEVRRAIWNGTEVAVKVMYRNSYKGDFSMFEKEVIILSHVRHPNVLMILAVTRAPDGNAIITEYMSGGSLHSLIRDCFFTLENQPFLRHKIASDICKGMAYLHANKPKPLLHRDLTSHNILLDRNLVTKVADFGLSHVKQDATNKTYGLGQVPWMAPEVLAGEVYTEKADVYSFGCILYELWTGRVPNAEFTDLNVFSDAIKTGYRPGIPPSVPGGWRNLIASCLRQDPTQRPHFKDILQHLDSLNDEMTDGRALDPLASLGSGILATIGWTSATENTNSADFSPCYLEDEAGTGDGNSRMTTDVFTMADNLAFVSTTSDDRMNSMRMNSPPSSGYIDD